MRRHHLNQRQAGISLIEVMIASGILMFLFSYYHSSRADQMSLEAKNQKFNASLDIRRLIKTNLSCEKTLKQTACQTSQGHVDLIAHEGVAFLGEKLTRAETKVRGVCGTSMNPNELKVEYQRKGEETWRDLYDGIPVACGTVPVSTGTCPYLDRKSKVRFPDMVFDLGMPIGSLYLPGSRYRCTRRHASCCIESVNKPGHHRVVQPWSNRVTKRAGVRNGYVGNNFEYAFYLEALPSSCSSPGLYIATIHNARSASCTISVNVAYGARGGSGCFAAGSEVLMADFSSKSISQVKVGDYVWNPRKKKKVKVINVIDGLEEKPLWVIRTELGSVTTTEDHPFVVGDKVIPASRLTTSDTLGDSIRILEIEVKKHDKIRVFNLELEGGEDPDEHILVVDGVPSGDLYLQRNLKNQQQTKIQDQQHVTDKEVATKL